MIIGAHSVVYSKNPEADRRFLRDVLKFPSVDVGEGWLIFGLPPSEVAVHPSEKNDVHEFYLMCADVEAFVTAMQRSSVTCGPVMNRGWGLLTEVRLPGGGTLGVYQPRHARPPAAAAKAGRTSGGRGAKTRARAVGRGPRAGSRRAGPGTGKKTPARARKGGARRSRRA